MPHTTHTGLQKDGNFVMLAANDNGSCSTVNTTIFSVNYYEYEWKYQVLPLFSAVYTQGLEKN